MGFSDLLSEEKIGPLSKKQKDYISRIQKNAKILQKQIDTMLLPNSSIQQKNIPPLPILSSHTVQSKNKILIVDDNEGNRILHQDFLNFSGYETQGAENGEMALKLTKEWMPNLILLDLNLPDMSGLDVTRQLKTNPITKDIPIAIVSAMPKDLIGEDYLTEGCIEYLEKPFSIYSFIEKINSLMGYETTPLLSCRKEKSAI